MSVLWRCTALRNAAPARTAPAALRPSPMSRATIVWVEATSAFGSIRERASASVSNALMSRPRSAAGTTVSACSHDAGTVERRGVIGIHEYQAIGRPPRRKFAAIVRLGQRMIVDDRALNAADVMSLDRDAGIAPLQPVGQGQTGEIVTKNEVGRRLPE